ncbi:DMT family transporter [Castellaniella sp.]|uniref:DMT family transporter n=1 Tax=Castellaniella sp. TaxID=1955812 RepID=UPI003C7941A4
MNDNVRGTLEMSAAMVIAGTIGWLVVLSGRPVTDVVFWRCLFGAATLLPVCLALGHFKRGRVTARQLGLAVLGGVAIVANWLLLFSAYSRASISIATVVYNVQPFMLVGLGVLLLHERLTRSRVFWLVLAFGGVLLIVQAQPEGQAAGSDYLTGVAMALGAAFFYAVAALIAKSLRGVPPHLIGLIQTVVGVALLWPLAHWSDPIASASWPYLVTLGVVHTGGMYILLYGAIQRLPTYLTGSLSFIYPIVAFLVDAWAFGKHPQLLQLLGASAILLGAAGMVLGWSEGPQALRMVRRRRA